MADQLELFPKQKVFDINELVEALLVSGDKLDRLSVLLEQVRANPIKRRSHKYAVRNPDGTIYRASKQEPSSPKPR